MAKIWQISDGRSYVVNGDPGTTITYTNSPSNGTAAGKPVTSIPTGATSVTFPSNGSEVEISSDTATIDQVFNAAAAGSGSSSGGSGSAGGVTFQIVTTLPSQGAAGVIYLVKVSETGDDRYEEWIWVDSAWESIGTTAVDPTTYAKLIGGNTFEGNQVINGDLTVTGDVSGVTESNYNVVETTETTITPTGGTWVRYTGTETSLTVVEPGWDGEAEISYLETAAPVDLQGVTWSPAKPILTGNGPFVYTLVHSREGEILAGAYGYSTPTAEAVQAVVPMKWESKSLQPITFIGGFAVGGNITCESGFIVATQGLVRHGAIVIGSGYGRGTYAVGVGQQIEANGKVSLVFGRQAYSDADMAITLGASFTDTEGSHTCQTQGTGSITIGAGANTLNNGDTESSNSVTIGCKAENKGADSVVIGSQASNISAGNVIIGAGAKSSDYSRVVSIGTNSMGFIESVAVGNDSKAYGRGTTVGYNTTANQFSTAIGNRASAYMDSIALGAGATASMSARRGIAIGNNATVSGLGATSIGNSTSTTAPNALTFGVQFDETVDGQTVTNYCKTEGTGSITIGAGANTLNPTNADGTPALDSEGNPKENSSSVTIGCKALNQGVESVVIGAGAGGKATSGVAIGTGAKSSDYSTVIGRNAAASYTGVAVGSSATAQGYHGTALGAESSAYGGNSVALGKYSTANGVYAVALGGAAKADPANTIAIGAGATITNTTNADNTVTPSENTIVIGAGATASAPNAVVMGAGASGTKEGSVLVGAGATEKSSYGKSVVIGQGANVDGYQGMLAIGYNAKAAYYGVSVGFTANAGLSGTAVGKGAFATGYSSTALGLGATARVGSSTAIGVDAVVDDIGTVVFATNTDPQTNAAPDWRKTQLYFSGANTPLANEYYNGEAFMGYTVTDKDNNVLACGTRRLSELFPDNSLTQPATLDEETGEWVMPKVFHPSDLDLPVEEPTEEPEDITINIPEPTIPEPEPYTPLPVYPIVEPEDATTNIPDPEPYTPLPVYPIVEPEVLEIVEEPTE